jgi:hypothetical protein
VAEVAAVVLVVLVVLVLVVLVVEGTAEGEAAGGGVAVSAEERNRAKRRICATTIAWWVDWQRDGLPRFFYRLSLLIYLWDRM